MVQIRRSYGIVYNEMLAPRYTPYSKRYRYNAHLIRRRIGSTVLLCMFQYLSVLDPWYNRNLYGGCHDIVSYPIAHNHAIVSYSLLVSHTSLGGNSQAQEDNAQSHTSLGGNSQSQGDNSQSCSQPASAPGQFDNKSHCT